MSECELLRAAKVSKQNAYAPYSKFAVGAAVETGSGQIYSGCNVENASYGLSNCAERVAICNAVAAGESQFRRLLVIADTQEPVFPCGACRQVMREFNIPEIILCNRDGYSITVGLSALLPDAFGPEQLKGVTGND